MGVSSDLFTSTYSIYELAARIMVQFSFDLSFQFNPLQAFGILYTFIYVYMIYTQQRPAVCNRI